MVVDAESARGSALAPVPVSVPAPVSAPARPATDPEACVPRAEHLERAFRFLGKRWNAVALGHLAARPAGFRELSRAIDAISDSMLSDRLAELTAGGLVSRTVDAGPPVAVSYALTERGRALMPALVQIAQWAEANLPQDACRKAEAAEDAAAQETA
ncbi:MAG: winged helix-turn-helix transcriptional regulator [Actinocrinis sp.]